MMTRELWGNGSWRARAGIALTRSLMASNFSAGSQNKKTVVAFRLNRMERGIVVKAARKAKSRWRKAAE